MSGPATVVQMITQLELGGAQEIALLACRELDRRRWRVHLITGPGGYLDDEAAGIPDLHFEQEPLLVREIRPATDARCLLSLTERLRRIRRESPGPMVVHTHSSKAGILGRWAAWRAGAEARVHSIHGFGFHPGQSWPVRRLLQASEQLTARITSAFCPVSQANLDVARELGLLSRGQAALVAPPGILPADYEPGPDDGPRVRKELGIPADAPVVGMLACLKPQKSPVDFVRVAAGVSAAHPETHFFIAGDGVLRPEVEREIDVRHLREHFHLLGWRRDVAALLGAADVVALTSLWEGLPRVCLQTMAARKPMVVARVDGVPEAIADGKNGFLLEPRDIDGFVDRIGRLVADPALARRMGEEGRRRLTPFDYRVMLEDLEALYERLLADAASR